jgi:rhodanese-related sulfurtransferase
MHLPRISPSDAKLLADKGALVIDIRETEEYARERIPGAKSHPQALLSEMTVPASVPAVVFHCKSGNRSTLNERALIKAAGNVDAFVIDGGIDAWKAAGLPIDRNTHQPIELTRQTQILAGSIVLAATILGYVLNPGFFIVPGIIGAALVLAGVTNSTAIHKLLRVMPWNRVQAL